MSSLFEAIKVGRDRLTALVKPEIRASVSSVEDEIVALQQEIDRYHEGLIQQQLHYEALHKDLGARMKEVLSRQAGLNLDQTERELELLHDTMAKLGIICTPQHIGQSRSLKVTSLESWSCVLGDESAQTGTTSLSDVLHNLHILRQAIIDAREERRQWKEKYHRPEIGMKGSIAEEH